MTEEEASELGKVDKEDADDSDGSDEDEIMVTGEASTRTQSHAQEDLRKQLEEARAAKAAAEKMTEELTRQLRQAKERTGSAQGSTTSSEGDSNFKKSGSVNKTLNDGHKSNLGVHISEIYADIKFLNDDTLELYPEIVGDAMDAMEMKTGLDKAMYGAAVKKEMKYMMAQKRGYSKKQVMKKYKGKNERMVEVTSVYRLLTTHRSSSFFVQTGGTRLTAKVSPAVLSQTTSTSSAWANMLTRSKRPRKNGVTSCCTCYPV